MTAPMTDGPKDERETGEQEPRLGTIILDRYRMDALVGSGSMGRVFVGEHVLLRKRVAMKVMHRELGEISEYAQRFEREAMAGANIGNEHIVAATDCGRLPNGSLFVVLDYVEGRTLREEMTHAFPAERALHIALQIADALDSAHQLGIVHRDLKPENVMLLAKGDDPDFVKVLDFGIAKVPLAEAKSGGKALTQVGAVFGTPEYMAPEQALAQAVDGRTDLYALGVMLYEMVTGVLPFATEGEACLGDKIVRPAPPFAERVPGLQINPAVEALVLKLLERNPNARFQSASDLRREIDGLLGAALLGAAPSPSAVASDDAAPPLASTTRARTFPTPPMLAIGAGVLLVLAIIVVLVSRKATAPALPDALPSASASAVATKQSVARASVDEIANAAAKGADALLELQRRYPHDDKIAMARSGVHMKEKDLLSAVHAVSDALAMEPGLKQDAQVASLLWIAAQNRKSADAAFKLLGGPMGDRGRDILKDLTTTSGVRPDVKAHAKETLERPEGFVP